jgi:hypothetical protein
MRKKRSRTLCRNTGQKSRRAQWIVQPGQGRVVKIRMFGSRTIPYKLQGCEMIRCESKRFTGKVTYELHQNSEVNNKSVSNAQPVAETKRKQTRKHTRCKTPQFRRGLDTIRSCHILPAGKHGNRMLTHRLIIQTRCHLSWKSRRTSWNGEVNAMAVHGIKFAHIAPVLKSLQSTSMHFFFDQSWSHTNCMGGNNRLINNEWLTLRSRTTCKKAQPCAIE